MSKTQQLPFTTVHIFSLRYTKLIDASIVYPYISMIILCMLTQLQDKLMTMLLLLHATIVLVNLIMLMLLPKVHAYASEQVEQTEHNTTSSNIKLLKIFSHGTPPPKKGIMKDPIFLSSPYKHLFYLPNFHFLR